jgi:ribosome-binding protein aMBF1 (putative translation factor)
MKKIGNTHYTTFEDLWNNDNLLDDDDRQRIQFQVDIIVALVEARQAKGYTQQRLAELSHVKQASLARVESMKHKPQIDTLNKLLRPLGKKLAIVDM